MDQFEKLAIAQAVYKAVADQVATKDPYNLRGECDEYMRQRYEESGEKLTKRIAVNGVEVGTISTKESKPIPQKVTRELVIKDMGALSEWMADGLEEKVDEFYKEIEFELVERFALWYARETGEVPDGCEVETVIEPERPLAYAGTVLRVDGAKVADALGSMLPAYVQNLLEGGE